MQYQDAFLLPPNLGRQGLLQITTPTEKDSAQATAMVSEAFEHVNSGMALLAG
jgi:hypothetical protein